MRLWSLHPRYLDTAGLLAVWREALLARKVLEGRTRGYRKHPQLDRFRKHPLPVAAIEVYLQHIFYESVLRGFDFDESKINHKQVCETIPVNSGQVSHEWQHLLNKLQKRQPELYRKHLGLRNLSPHPLFRIFPGPVEKWEKQEK